MSVAWVNKGTSGSATSLEKQSDGKHAQGDLLAGLSSVTATKKKEKKKDKNGGERIIKKVMYAFYMSLE